MNVFLIPIFVFGIVVGIFLKSMEEDIRRTRSDRD